MQKLTFAQLRSADEGSTIFYTVRMMYTGLGACVVRRLDLPNTHPAVCQVQARLARQQLSPIQLLRRVLVRSPQQTNGIATRRHRRSRRALRRRIRPERSLLPRRRARGLGSSLLAVCGHEGR